jgi:hypothetical protein
VTRHTVVALPIRKFAQAPPVRGRVTLFVALRAALKVEKHPQIRLEEHREIRPAERPATATSRSSNNRAILPAPLALRGSKILPHTMTALGWTGASVRSGGFSSRRSSIQVRERGRGTRSCEGHKGVHVAPFHPSSRAS